MMSDVLGQLAILGMVICCVIMVWLTLGDE